jgi:hypothetical protein
MNKVKNATKAKNTNKPLIEKQGNTLVINEQLSGKKLERILTPLQVAKKDYKNEANEKRNSLSYNLKLLKDECKKGDAYIKELNSKYELKVSGKEVFNLLSNPKEFIPYLTEAQLIKYSEDRLNFTPSLIIEAISKYFKATYKALKIA